MGYVENSHIMVEVLEQDIEIGILHTTLFRNCDGSHAI